MCKKECKGEGSGCLTDCYQRRNQLSVEAIEDAKEVEAEAEKRAKEAAKRADEAEKRADEAEKRADEAEKKAQGLGE